MTLAGLWFWLIALLFAGYVILDGFDLGVAMLHPFLCRSEEERRIAMTSIGPVWDGNEVWLLTGGGALFAAFAPVYATVFSALYLPLVLVLVFLVLRAVSLEFRSKVPSEAWRRAWDRAFFAGSAVPALLFGVAAGNILRGLPLDERGEYAGGFFDLLNPFALLVGFLALAMFLLQGATWLQWRAAGALAERARAAARSAAVAVLLLWGAATLLSQLDCPERWAAFSSPLPWLVPLLAIFFLAGAWFTATAGRGAPAFTMASASAAAFVATGGLTLYPVLLPARANPELSLTVANAASSALTLRTMLLLAAVGVPIVLAYTVFIYRRFRGPVALDEHGY